MANILRAIATNSARCGLQSLKINSAPTSTRLMLNRLVAPTSLVSHRFCGLNVSGGHENHSKTWTIERALSAGLLALTPAAYVLSSSVVDYLIAAAFVVHVHWGLEAIVVDYIRPSIFGPVIPRIALGILYVLSILSLGGLCYFNYTDVGMSQGMRMAWNRL